MAEPEVAGVDPGERGSLVVKERAVARIATAAALETPEVVRRSGGFGRLTGRELPRADVSLSHDAVAINVYVALTWPCRLVEVTATVHDTVARRVGELTGLPVHSLEIIVAGTVGDETATLPPAHTTDGPAPAAPRATPGAAYVSVLVGLLLIGVAVVAGRDFLIARETISGAPWLANSVEWVARLHWIGWMLPVAAASTAVGLLLLWIACAPRARTHLSLKQPAVFVRPVDIARSLSAHARSAAHVDSAHTSVTRRKAVVTVHVHSPSEHSVDSVLSATEPVTSALQPPLAVTVNVRPVRESVR